MIKLEQLNDAQRKAVTHGEGPLLVLAGPGSGKTFTITQRILYLIEILKVPPEEILVITFTKEAALAMQQRFQQQSDKIYPVNFGTFHSVFYQILNQSKRTDKIQILQESQKKKLIYPIVKKYHNIIYNQSDSGNNYEILWEEVALFLAAVSFHKNTGNMEESSKKLPQEWRPVFKEVYREYEYVRKQTHGIDFDDMVYECAEMLEKDRQIRSYWQNRFSHILIDEMQDINPMQFRVVGLLTKPPYNLFAVGDDDQSIYGFRGSKPACLKQFQKDYNAKQVLLNVNYRSYEEIIKASLLVIEENKERFPKQLIAEQSKTIEYTEQNNRKVHINAFTEKEEQYTYLTQMISEMNQYDTCAVLFRTNSYMQGFAARLRQEGISFVMKEKSDSIYENTVVKDIMAYLQLASGVNQRELWLQILNKPSRYISREALAGDAQMPMIEKMKAYYDTIKTGDGSFLYKDKINSAITALEKQLGYLKNATPFLGVQYIRKVIGYEQYVKTTCKGKRNGEERLEEILELLDWLTDDAKHYSTIEEWKQAQELYTRSLRDKTGKVRILQNTEDTPHIHLMTIHASKGLEFDCVCIPDCNEKIFPHGSMPDTETCEEERRIFYVGMTRAKKNLELLCVTGTKERPRLVSRFLNPLWKEYFSSVTGNYSSSSTISSNSH